MKQWIEHHTADPPKAASLLAFMVWCLPAFKIHPVKTAPKIACWVCLACKKTASTYMFLPKSGFRRLVVTGPRKGRRKDAKIGWLCLHSSKIWKAASFTQEDTSFGAQVQLGYGTPVGDSSYTIGLKQDDNLHSIQFCAPIGSIIRVKERKTGRFTGYQTLDGKKGKRTAVEDAWKIRSSCCLTAKDSKVSKLSYQVSMDWSFNFERNCEWSIMFDEEGWSRWSSGWKEWKNSCCRFCVCFRVLLATAAHENEPRLAKL